DGGNGQGQVQWTFAVDDALVQGLGSFQSVNQTYTVQLSDGHGGLVTQSVRISINGVNDVPVVTVPGNSVSTPENTPINLTSAHVSDADLGDTQTATITVSHGTLTTLGSGTGL